MERLNMGSGKDYRKGWVNIDDNPHYKKDTKHDLAKTPYPFKENTFDLVLCRDILEHFDDPLKVLKEIYRISKPGAKIIIRVPHYTSVFAWADLTHKRAFSGISFSHFEKDPRYYGKDCRFNIKRIRYDLYFSDSFLHSLLNGSVSWLYNLSVPLTELLLCKIFPVNLITFELKVNKHGK